MHMHRTGVVSQRLVLQVAHTEQLVALRDLSLRLVAWCVPALMILYVLCKISNIQSIIAQIFSFILTGFIH